MKPYHSDPLVTLYLGDCNDVMTELPDSSVESIVTDPPYGLEFMGKEWDRLGDVGQMAVGLNSPDPGPWGRQQRVAYGSGANVKCGRCRKWKRDHPERMCKCGSEAQFPKLASAEGKRMQAWHEAWATEAFRVLKPGGYMIAFGGTRTYHRLASAIEDAGFEIRDTLMWIYASGFPKSLDVGKALDKAAGAEREVVGPSARHGGGQRNGYDYGGGKQTMGNAVVPDITAPATDLARQWDGWGTALKPAHEPIVMARKPLVGTVAGNVTRYGVGALNIDGTRIPGTEAQSYTVKRLKPGATLNKTGGNWRPEEGPEYHGETKAGRWPSNILLSDPELFDQPNPYVVGSGATDAGSFYSGPRKSDTAKWTGVYSDEGGKATGQPGYGDSGGYSRFFRIPSSDPVVAVAQSAEHRAVNPEVDGANPSGHPNYPSAFLIPKAGREERERGLAGAPLVTAKTMQDNGGNLRTGSGNERNLLRANSHPTVKPIDLMRHLVRLVTPPGGTVLDPFLGSGTTALAASEEGVKCIGIEREAEYLDIAVGRLMATPMGLGLDVPAPTRKRPPIKDGAIGGNGLGSHYDRLGNTEPGVDFRHKRKPHEHR